MVLTYVGEMYMKFDIHLNRYMLTSETAEFPRALLSVIDEVRCLKIYFIPR